MLPYLGMFLLIIISSKAYQYFDDNKDILYRVSRLFFALVVVLIPAIMAGVRDLSIGVDIQVYIIPTFNSVKSSSSLFQAISNVANITYIDSINVGLTVIEYIVSLLNGDVHGVLFGISLVNGISVFIASRVLKDDCDMWVFQLVYLTMLYNASYNAMRQCMAICFCLIGFAYMLKGNLKAYIIISFLSTILFHNSAILAFLLIPVNHGLKRINDKRLANKNSKRRKTRYLLIILVGIMFIVLLRPLVGVVDRVFHWTYSRYWDYYRSDLSILRFTVYLITMMPLYFYAKKEKHRDIITGTAIVDLLTYLLSFSIFYFYRISMIFMMMCKATGYAEIVHRASYHNKKKMTINKTTVVIILICLLYWFYTFVYANMHETIPYQMM